MANFLIATPPYSPRSGGIMVLHELCTALNKIGHRAGISIITEGSQSEQNFKFGFSSNPQYLDPNGQYFDYFTDKTQDEVSRFISACAVIYPDIVRGNPLGGRTFATYVLGVPRFNISAPTIIAFSKIYIDRWDCHLFKPFLSPYMINGGTNHWTNRTLSLTYIGKGSEFLQCHVVPETVLIERDWPRDKQQLAILLRQCKYFFSWDCVSATNFDAVMCGAVPVLLHDLQIPRSQLDTSEIGASLPSIDIDVLMRDPRSTPSCVAEIDAALDLQRSKARHYQDTWLERVRSVAEVIVTRL